MAIIAKDWRTQFQQVFHLQITKEKIVAKEWELGELFPSLKENADKQEPVRISDCQYPGAARPLRLLSSMLCLNTTHQHHIATPFAKHILDAINGKAVDWPQEFYYEVTEELLHLHAKHRAARVKVGKTSIGPHVTIILKAAGILNIREEMEAGYRSSKALTVAEQVPHPKLKKAKEGKGTETQPRIRVHPPLNLEAPEEPRGDSTPTATVYTTISKAAAATQEAAPKGAVILETTQPRQPPKSLPPMVDQICQAHRRLENLLVSFTTKAPARFVNQMNNEFFKVQREAILHQASEQPGEKQLEVLLKAQEAQLQHLTTQLANAEGLNDINIEAIFHLEEKTATMQQELHQAQEEVLSLRAQKGEALEKLKTIQDRVEDKIEQIGAKDKEIAHLNTRITDMSGMLHRADSLVASQKATILRLESQMADLNLEPHRLEAESTTGWEKASTHQVGSISESDITACPIMNKEKHTLTSGVANKLLQELRRDLARTQQEKADLLQKIGVHMGELRQDTLPQAVMRPNTEIFYQILKHNRPLESIMQYHRAYGGLHLLLSSIPLLITGSYLNFSQVQEIWTHANAAAKDTLAFMWSLGELKTPLGAMETITGSPAFYTKRYILRCFVLLGQQHNMMQIPREPFPILKSYTHSQFHAVRDFQRSNMHYFDQALVTLATEDTAICYEAVQHYQALVNKCPDGNLQPTLSQLKDFVTKTLDEQHTALSRRRFGTINNGTLLIKPKDQMQTTQESIGTCFL
jgi:hypothetical protein